MTWSRERGLGVKKASFTLLPIWIEFELLFFHYADIQNFKFCVFLDYTISYFCKTYCTFLIDNVKFWVDISMRALYSFIEVEIRYSHKINLRITILPSNLKIRVLIKCSLEIHVFVYSCNPYFAKKMKLDQVPNPGMIQAKWDLCS